MSEFKKYYSRGDIGDNDFWDLSKNGNISRPAPSYPIHKKTNTEGVLIESGETKSSTEISVKIPEKKTQFNSPDTILEYTPKNIFINKIKITTSDKNKNVFDPSALFMRERAALLDRKGVPSDYVSFYSHSPRYSSLTRAQLNYYLWWRENVRNGEFIKTDISYVKLYVQEIVTARDGENIEGCISDLIKISKTCFDNPVGKIYMARIISDFCLLHGIECPIEQIQDSILDYIFNHIADEFYLGLSESNRHIYAPIAIKYISIYDYKRSKFYDGFNKPLFDEHIRAAMHSCFVNDQSYKEIVKNASGIFSTKLTDRKLFDGRVEFCAQSTRILISYFPVKCISGIVTDAIRYCENKLRSLLGIRTSLAVGELPQEITCVIDDYFRAVSHEFDGFKSSIKQKAEKKEAEEYDRLYDIPKRELSLSNAKEIEASSWETTKKLTEAFLHESIPEENKAADIPCTVQSITQSRSEETSIPTPPTAPKASHHWGEHLEFLLICRNGSAQNQRAYAKTHGMTIDELADTINELAVDMIGDIILDFDGEKYTIIEDYIDIIEEK